MQRISKPSCCTCWNSRLSNISEGWGDLKPVSSLMSFSNVGIANLHGNRLRWWYWKGRCQRLCQRLASFRETQWWPRLRMDGTVPFQVSVAPQSQYKWWVNMLRLSPFWGTLLGRWFISLPTKQRFWSISNQQNSSLWDTRTPSSVMTPAHYHDVACVGTMKP